MKEHIGKRILIATGQNDAPQMTTLYGLSPNGKYGLFKDAISGSESIGWWPVDDVKVLDVLGEGNEVMTDLVIRLRAMGLFK
jgi:hypothetical protein